MCLLPNEWAAAEAARLDTHYGSRRAWRQQEMCFQEAILAADPGRIGPDGARELARRQAERGFSIQLWLSGAGSSCGETQGTRAPTRRGGPDPLLVD